MNNPNDPALNSLPKTKVTKKMKEIIDKANKDYDQIGQQQRFGYFSIPANELLGDCYYSQEKEFNHKVIDRNVIIEKRGVYTMGPKLGKTPDAYFECMDKMDPNTQKRLEAGHNKDIKDLLKKVDERKHAPIVTNFKYPGVQAYKDYIYDLHPFKRDYPLDRPKPSAVKVVDQKVITENRGIYTNPMKKGFYNTPGILFSYSPLGLSGKDKVTDKMLQEYRDKKQGKGKKRCNSAYPAQTAYRKAFFPASLKKCECFSDIKQTYGYEPAFFNMLKKESDKQRKADSCKYEKKLPENAIKHMRPFTPSSNAKSGRDGLFNQHIWDCPSIPEKRVIVNQR